MAASPPQAPATAIQLVRAALRTDPETGAGAEEFERQVLASVEHYNETARLQLICSLAQLGGYLARQMPAESRELFLSLLAGQVDTDG